MRRRGCFTFNYGGDTPLEGFLLSLNTAAQISRAQCHAIQAAGADIERLNLDKMMWDFCFFGSKTKKTTTQRQRMKKKSGKDILTKNESAFRVLYHGQHRSLPVSPMPRQVFLLLWRAKLRAPAHSGQPAVHSSWTGLMENNQRCDTSCSATAGHRLSSWTPGPTSWAWVGRGGSNPPEQEQEGCDGSLAVGKSGGRLLGGGGAGVV